LEITFVVVVRRTEDAAELSHLLRPTYHFIDMTTIRFAPRKYMYLPKRLIFFRDIMTRHGIMLRDSYRVLDIIERSSDMSVLLPTTTHGMIIETPV